MLLQAYITQHNYNVICLPETFLNSSSETNNDRILIDGYNLKRADHPSDSKRGGVCICYKEHIPLIKRDDICTLDNCLMTEIRLQGEKCFLTCIYRSPSQPWCVSRFLYKIWFTSEQHQSRISFMFHCHRIF